MLHGIHTSPQRPGYRHCSLLAVVRREHIADSQLKRVIPACCRVVLRMPSRRDQRSRIKPVYTNIDQSIYKFDCKLTSAIAHGIANMSALTPMWMVGGGNTTTVHEALHPSLNGPGVNIFPNGRPDPASSPPLSRFCEAHLQKATKALEKLQTTLTPEEEQALAGKHILNLPDDFVLPQGASERTVPRHQVYDRLTFRNYTSDDRNALRALEETPESAERRKMIRAKAAAALPIPGSAWSLHDWLQTVE